MKKWKIPVTWEVCAVLEVESCTLEEAMKIAADAYDNEVIPLPIESNYVDGSWRLSEDYEEDIRYFYNRGQNDDEKAAHTIGVEDAKKYILGAD